MEHFSQVTSSWPASPIEHLFNQQVHPQEPQLAS
jgi:hypothetical protein